MDEMTAGLMGKVERTVTAVNTAEALGSGDLPVLATPALVAWLEAAACTALAGHLPADMTTVGTAMEMKHLAATPVGLSVTAAATLVEVAGRKLVFRVEAQDCGGVIGAGRHERYLVAREPFMARAQAKVAPPAQG